jgi:hypothetical protein
VSKVWLTQFVPPFVVFKIVPYHPTTYPVCSPPGKWTERRIFVVPEVWLTHPAWARQGARASIAARIKAITNVTFLIALSSSHSI